MVQQPGSRNNTSLKIFISISNQKEQIYKLMCWLYKVRYDIMYYYDVVGYSSNDVNSGAL